MEEIQDLGKLAEEIVEQLSIQQKTPQPISHEEKRIGLRLKEISKQPMDQCDGKAKLLDKGKQKVDESDDSYYEERHKRMAFGALAERSSKLGGPEIRIEKRAPSGPNWVLVNPGDIACDYSSDEDD